MPTFKLTLAYDGTEFVGWQRQASGISIQGLLEDSFAELDGRSVAVIGAGRTDAGVHALGQVASVTLARTIDCRTVRAALNAKLPETVRVVDVEDVADSFHARFHARRKTYRYRIWNDEVLSPFERRYVWHVPVPELDTEAMAAAAHLLEGRHDFTAFQGTGAVTLTGERTVFSSRICRGERGASAVEHRLSSIITYEIVGDGFLRHMVRAIVGTLVEVGRGRRPPEWMNEVLMSKDRTRAGKTAPPQGLFLIRVDY